MTRLKIISIDAGEKLGTYGFIKNAKLFVVCAVKRDFYENSPEVCGFLFEEFVLAATSLGINTCWLGGTFTRSRFAEQIDLKDDELIPYISPIGIAADKKRWFDRTLRSLAKADSRLDASLLFFQGDLQHPLDLASIGDYAQALQMVRIAPSASNKQPWRVVKVGNLYHFYLLRNQGYAKPSGVP